MNMGKRSKIFQLSLVLVQLQLISSQPHKNPKADNVVAEMQVVCHSDAIVLKINTNTPFNGMLYAKEAPSNNNCVTQYYSASNMTFRLPLKSCGTLFTEVDDGIEYFNTIVVQPHMRLMTNQGKGYHIRCKYQTRERTIANTHFNVSAAFTMQNGPQALSTPLLATASMPTCTMKIFRSGRDDVAETVKIGDKLIMIIEIDQQDMYGMKITNCVVRDGLNMAEEQLINDIGCPVDESIMPKFDYSSNYTRAAVSFPAHKFPHTSSVYYQCNVRLCINNGGCDQTNCNVSDSAMTTTSPSNNLVGVGGGSRSKRFVGHSSDPKHLKPATSNSNESQASILPIPDKLRSRDGTEDMSFDVYSGLYVNDIDVGNPGASDVLARRNLSSARQTNVNDGQQLTEQLCLSPNKAGLMVVLASLASVGLVLMIGCQVGLFGRSNSIIDHHQPHHQADFAACHYASQQNYLDSARRTRNRHAMGAFN